MHPPAPIAPFPLQPPPPPPPPRPLQPPPLPLLPCVGVFRLAGGGRLYKSVISGGLRPLQDQWRISMDGTELLSCHRRQRLGRMGIRWDSCCDVLVLEWTAVIVAVPSNSFTVPTPSPSPSSTRGSLGPRAHLIHPL